MICMIVIEKHCLGARSQENEGSGSKRPKVRLLGLGAGGRSAQRKGRTPKQDSKSCEIQILDRSPFPFTIKH